MESVTPGNPPGPSENLTPAARKRVEWFKEGAAALAPYVKQPGMAGKVYACPLCLEPGDRDDAVAGRLSLEHVPPGSLGGREVVLTCESCNNQHGTWFDSQAAQRQRLRELFSGESFGPEDVTLRLPDGTSARCNWYDHPGGMLFEGIPAASNPAFEERFREVRTFNLELRARFSPERAALSWIRTAYLAAFALFGWRWVLNPVLDPIRLRLQSESAGSNRLPILSATGLADQRRQLLIVERPADLKGLLVFAWDSEAVFLPGVGARQPLEEIQRRLGATPGGRISLQASGKTCDWPTQPLYSADR